MKGYLAFLLVFASVFLILNIIMAAEQASKISFSEAIAAERVYQAQMNAKEVVLEAVRLGGTQAYDAYDSSHDVADCDDCNRVLPGPRCKTCFRYPDANDATQSGALSELRSLERTSFDAMNVTIWCQQGMTRDVAGAIIAGSTGADSGCADAILPIIEPDANPKQNPHLKELKMMEDIVVMVSYAPFNITAVSWIHAGYRVEP